MKELLIITLCLVLIVSSLTVPVIADTNTVTAGDFKMYGNLIEGSELAVKGSITSDTDKTVSVITALYDENNNLIDVDIGKRNLLANTKKDINVYFRDLPSSITTKSFAKVFVWDNLTPIAKSIVPVYSSSSTEGGANSTANNNIYTFDNVASFAENTDFTMGGGYASSNVSISSDYDYTTGSGKSLKLANRDKTYSRVKLWNMLSEDYLGKTLTISAYVYRPATDAASDIRIRLGIYDTAATSPDPSTYSAVNVGEWVKISFDYKFTDASKNLIGIDQYSSTEAVAKNLYIDNISVTVPQTITEDNTGSEISAETVKFYGRYEKTDLGYTVNWPMNGIEFTFTGTNAEVYINAASNENKYFGVTTLDTEDDIMDYNRLKINGSGWYRLFKNDLPYGTHTIRFARSSEGNRQTGYVYLSNIRTDGTNPVPSAASNKTIEFIGDSYTAGYGNLSLSSSGETKNAENTDAWKSYAGWAARKLGADASVIAVSGKGVIVNSDGKASDTMADRFVFADETAENKGTKTNWDFSLFTPKVVVLFLGTNDAGGINKSANSDDPITPDEFKEKYKEFVQTIRSKYPNANIICTSKPSNCMRDEVTAVVEELQKTDTKLHRLILQTFAGGGIDAHPYYTNAEKMCDELIDFINTIDGVWN